MNKVSIIFFSLIIFFYCFLQNHLEVLENDRFNLLHPFLLRCVETKSRMISLNFDCEILESIWKALFFHRALPQHVEFNLAVLFAVLDQDRIVHENEESCFLFHRLFVFLDDCELNLSFVLHSSERLNKVLDLELTSEINEAHFLSSFINFVVNFNHGSTEFFDCFEKFGSIGVICMSVLEKIFDEKLVSLKKTKKRIDNRKKKKKK